MSIDGGVRIEERIYQGDKAREVLENDAFLWAFESIEKELEESWKSSPARDAEGREKIYLMLQMLYKARAALQTRLETGRLAKRGGGANGRGQAPESVG